jgi:hypothetical protein
MSNAIAQIIAEQFASHYCHMHQVAIADKQATMRDVRKALGVGGDILEWEAEILAAEKATREALRLANLACELAGE